MRKLLSPSTVLRALPWVALVAVTTSAAWAMDVGVTGGFGYDALMDAASSSSFVDTDTISRVLGCEVSVGVADSVPCYDPPTGMLCTMLDAGVDADCRGDAPW